MKQKICTICHKPAKHILFVDGLQDKYNIEHYCFCSFKCLSDWLVVTGINKEYQATEINKMIKQMSDLATG
jgi:hypothetical protein